MNTKSKSDPNRGSDQQSIWRNRAYCDEGTEFDLRWGVTAEFSNGGAPSARAAEELLLAQISGKILSAWEADSVDSTIAGSIPW